MGRTLATWRGMWIGLFCLGPLSMGGAENAAQSPVPDKSAYHLFNPTPQEFLRELVTDRPDKTESPYTVDAGHFQVEMDLVSYSYDKHNDLPNSTEAESWAVAPINLKVGLLNNLDAQVVLETYNSVRTHERATGPVTHQSGFGDVIPRLKYNIWGNDGGSSALALMPFVKLPTSQNGLGNHSIEGGLIIPLALELPGGLGLGLMTEFDATRNAEEPGYHPEFINSITLSRDLIGKLGGYVEFFSLVSAESRTPWVGTFDLGFTYGVTSSLQLDCGINIGLTRSADDLNPFIGLSFRY